MTPNLADTLSRTAGGNFAETLVDGGSFDCNDRNRFHRDSGSVFHTQSPSLTFLLLNLGQKEKFLTNETRYQIFLTKR